MIMRYQNIREAEFISRPNRFIAKIKINGAEEICHVKNTGRLGEILKKGCRVYVGECFDSGRKTKFDLIAAESENQIINIDSQAPNKVVGEWLSKSGCFYDIRLQKPECKFRNSRFDFYLEADGKKIFIEVKGVTLKRGEVALFPDAPTERGVKHLTELCECVDEGYDAYVIFVAKMKGVRSFSPNEATHPEFAEALRKAKNKGVKILCVDCRVESDLLEINSFIDVVL